MDQFSRKWPFKASMVADAPETSGLYALWGGDHLLYVGRANGGEDTLKARLAEHLARAAASRNSGTALAPTHYSWKICNPRERSPEIELHARG